MSVSPTQPATEASTLPSSPSTNQLTKASLSTLLSQMINDSSLLANGYNVLSKYETCNGFYCYLLEIGLLSMESKALKKLSTSVFLTFLFKNYSNENSISDNEKLNLVSYMLNNLYAESQ